MDDEQTILVGLLSDSKLAPVEIKLPEETRSDICKALKRASDDPAILMFLDMLEVESGTYAVLEKQRQQQETFKQRSEALKALCDSIGEVIKGLSSLDTLSYRTLLQVMRSEKGINGVVVHERAPGNSLPNVTHPNPLGDLQQDLQVLSNIIDGLDTIYQRKIKPGARDKQARRDLIDFIVQAYKVCFDRWPVSTISNQEYEFIVVLRLVYDRLDIDVTDLESDVKRSLRRVRGKQL